MGVKYINRLILDWQKFMVTADENVSLKENNKILCDNFEMLLDNIKKYMKPFLEAENISSKHFIYKELMDD